MLKDYVHTSRRDLCLYEHQSGPWDDRKDDEVRAKMLSTWQRHLDKLPNCQITSTHTCLPKWIMAESSMKCLCVNPTEHQYGRRQGCSDEGFNSVMIRGRRLSKLATVTHPCSSKTRKCGRTIHPCTYCRSKGLYHSIFCHTHPS